MAPRLRPHVNGINWTNPSIGQDSGASLTTGQRNLLLGNRAGAGLTTGSHNTLVGSYEAAEQPDLQGAVLLSNGQGTVVSAWDAGGTHEQPVQSVAGVTAPSVNGRTRTALDPATGALVYLTRTTTGQTVTSYSATKASVDALGVNAASLGGLVASAYQPRSETLLSTTGAGTTMVADPTALQLRGLAVTGGGLSLDASDPAVVTLAALPGPSLADETVPASPPSFSLVGASSGQNNTLRTKRVVAGTGINVTETGTTLTIENTQTSTGVTLSSDGPAGSASLVTDGLGPALAVRGLVQGPGITLSSDTNSVTIGSAVALASETGTGGQSLVSMGSGATLRTKYLAVGTGLSLTPEGTTGLRLANTVVAPTLASAGGAVGLVGTGGGPSLTVKGLTAGYGVGLVDDGAATVTVRSNAVTTVPLRPADVVATSGQCRVVPGGVPLNLAAWPLDADLVALAALPAVRYRASAAANHVGALLVAVHGLPSDAANHGLRLQVTLQAPRDAPAFTWGVQVTVPCPSDSVPNVWDYHQYTGSLVSAAFQSSGTNSPPSQVYDVALAATTTRNAPGTVACVDGATRPRLPLLNGQTLHPSPTLMAVRLTGAAPLGADVDVLGLVLRLVPSLAS